eukprot:1843268-Rhodomonas_salina.1
MSSLNTVLGTPVAGRHGGGLYSSGCNALKDSKSMCFIGNIKVGNEPSVMVLLQGNSAAAGGGFFSACQLGVCTDLMSRKVGLPSWNKTYPSFLECRDNVATRYGANAASTPTGMVVADGHQAKLVPGQDVLNVTLSLVDSLGQQVDGRVEQHFVEMLVCAARDGCSLTSSLQPMTILFYNSGAQMHIAEQEVLLRYCSYGGSPLFVMFTTRTQQGTVTATVEVECTPCQQG